MPLVYNVMTQRNARDASSSDLVCVALLGCATQATACYAPGHHSSDELIREAESIVVAKAIAGTREHFDSPAWQSRELTQFQEGLGRGPQVTFEVVRTLKGIPPGKRFDLVGSLKYFGPNEESVPYSLARPGAQRGTCFAYDYKLGATFLLFLKNGNPYWSAVRPTNEEVRGNRDKWLVWVESRATEAPNVKHGSGARKLSLMPNQSPEPTPIGKPPLAALPQR